MNFRELWLTCLLSYYSTAVSYNAVFSWNLYLNISDQISQCCISQNFNLGDRWYPCYSRWRSGDVCKRWNDRIEGLSLDWALGKRNFQKELLTSNIPYHKAAIQGTSEGIWSSCPLFWYHWHVDFIIILICIIHFCNFSNS